MSAWTGWRTPLPRRPRWITFLASAFALAPLVLVASAQRNVLVRAPFDVPTEHLLSALSWALWLPGRFLHRISSFGFEQAGVGQAMMPAMGVVLGALALMLVTVSPTSTRTTPRRRIAAGLVLALAPTFLIAVTMGAPVLFGLIAWAVTVRAMGPCEGRDNIQQEMSMGIGTSFVLLSEPLAWWLIVPFFLGMPWLLRRGDRTATAAAVALCITPVLMMLAAIVCGLAILSESWPLPHLLRWFDALATVDPLVPLMTMGADLVFLLALVTVPCLVLVVIALNDPRRRNHPGALILGAGAPTVAMLVLAGAGHADAARVLALYAITGQALWLAQTPIPRRAFRVAIAFQAVGLLGQYLL